MMPSSVKRRRKVEVAPKQPRKPPRHLVRAAEETPQLDPKQTYRKACRELAEEIGFSEEEVLARWIWLTLMKIYELKIPQAAAEHDALVDVRAVLDKRGRSEPS